MERRFNAFIMKYSRQTILAGFIFICFLFMAINLLTIHRGTENMENAWEFTCGMEILGIVTCLVVYYSCMQNQYAYGSMTNRFCALLVTAALSLFLDEWSWLVQGVPERRVENVASNVLLYINTYTMGLMFWIYAYNVLEVKTKIVRLSTKVFFALYLIASFICVLNIFFPIYFTIDAAGVYSRAPLYSFRMFCYIALIPGVIEIIFSDKVSIRERIIVSSFIALPLLAETLSYFRFGMSTKPTASMLAIVLNYVGLVAKRDVNISKAKGEVEIASNIQKGILPKDTSRMTGRKNYDIYASMTPVQEVGGDYYDYFMIDDTHLAILVADVSDKGLGAAFFVMITKVLIKTKAELGGTPSEIIKYVDDRMSKANTSLMFVTMWLGIIDLANGHVEACNAGHDYPAILRSQTDQEKSEGFVIEKTEHGPPIAFLPGMPFPGISFDLKPGDRIFLYTDGLTEAKRIAPVHSGTKHSKAERFGTDRMLEVLNTHKSDNSRNLITAMQKAVADFADDEPQFDDITMLTFTYL